jgi:hypothetical protein
MTTMIVGTPGEPAKTLMNIYGAILKVRRKVTGDTIVGSSSRQPG